MREMEEEFPSPFPLRVRMPACRRGGRKMGKRGASREREKREREIERERESLLLRNINALHKYSHVNKGILNRNFI